MQMCAYPDGNQFELPHEMPFDTLEFALYSRGINCNWSWFYVPPIYGGTASHLYLFVSDHFVSLLFLSLLEGLHVPMVTKHSLIFHRAFRSISMAPLECFIHCFGIFKIFSIAEMWGTHYFSISTDYSQKNIKFVWHRLFPDPCWVMVTYWKQAETTLKVDRSSIQRSILFDWPNFSASMIMFDYRTQWSDWCRIGFD